MDMYVSKPLVSLLPFKKTITATFAHLLGLR